VLVTYRPEVSVDSIRNLFYLAAAKTSDIGDFDFRYTASAFQRIKHGFWPRSISHLLHILQQVNDFVLIVRGKSIEPSLHGAALRR
jgi:hypothetical protein